MHNDQFATRFRGYCPRADHVEIYYSSRFPRKVCVFRLRDGTPICETVNSEEELDALAERIDEGREYVRRYFEQYAP